MKLKKKIPGFLLTAVTILVVACASQMEPAQKALDGIASAISAAESAGAAKYIPEQFSATQAKLADLKAAFDKKDYASVLKGAPALLTEAQSLVGAAAAKKDEVVKAATETWTTLSASLPQLIATVKSRVDVLSKSKHAPAGVDLEAAKTGLADATALWDKAQAAFNGGNVEDAVAAANDVKAKAEAAAAALKLTLPAAK
jgi:hypothetical protein